MLRLCARDAVPFVARGAGTGLSGGALPVADGIVVSIARMNRILEVDVEGERVVVEPGVTNLDVTRAVVAAGLLLRARPLEPAGLHHRRERGRELGRCALPQARLHRQPRDGREGRAAGRRAARARRQGDRRRRRPRSPRCVRRLRGDARDRGRGDAPGRSAAGGRRDAARRVRIGRRGGRRRVAHRRRRDPAGGDGDHGPVHDPGGGGGVQPRLSGGRGRSAAGRARRRRGPGRGGHCGRSKRSAATRAPSRSAPRAPTTSGRSCGAAARARSPRWGASRPTTTSRTASYRERSCPTVLRRIEELSEEHGLRVGNVFHAGDGNLHPLVLYDGAVDGEYERAKTLADAILDACVDAGGSLTGEHGIGVDKACAMPSMFSERDLEVFERVRRAFDPDGARESRARCCRRRGSAARCQGRTAPMRSSVPGSRSGSDAAAGDDRGGGDAPGRRERRGPTAPDRR